MATAKLQLNPEDGRGLKIWRGKVENGKLESVKKRYRKGRSGLTISRRDSDRMTATYITDAEAAGRLKPGATIVEGAAVGSATGSNLNI